MHHVTALLLFMGLAFVAAKQDCTKKIDSPIVQLFVTPEYNLKGRPVQINVTCMGKATDALTLPLQKMWISRNETSPQVVQGPQRNYCHKTVCNHTMHLNEVSYGNETEVEVHCSVYPSTFHCTHVSRKIPLLDRLPTPKPASTPAEAKGLVASDSEGDSPSIKIIAVSSGVPALLICMVVMSVCIHQKIKHTRGSQVSMDPVRPDPETGTTNEDRGFPVYPVDLYYPDNPSAQQEEVFSIGPGLSLNIPKPLEILGSGNFGTVVLGNLETFSDAGRQTSNVAVKMLKDVENPKRKKEFQKEIDSLKDLEHSNIVKLIDTLLTSARLYIIMEYVSRGNLVSLLHEEKHKFANQLQYLYRFAYNIACGMEFLASKKKIHRDLAARNVLISEDYIAKISDFGLARSIEESGQYVTTQGYIPLKWVALEALESRTFTVESDVWSYGIVLWEMFSMGEEPYEFDISEQSVNALRQHLKRGDRLKQPELCCDETYSMMLRCWDGDQNRRPSFTELKKWAHPFANL